MYIYRYVELYKLPEPCDDIHSVLDSIGKRIGALTKGIIIILTTGACVMCNFNYRWFVRSSKIGNTFLTDVQKRQIRNHHSRHLINHAVIQSHVENNLSQVSPPCSFPFEDPASFAMREPNCMALLGRRAAVWQ